MKTDQSVQMYRLFEPPHDKTNKMACVPSEDSDQPGHPLRTQAFFMRPEKTLIRLGGGPG